MFSGNFYEGVFVFRDDGGNPFMARIFKRDKTNGPLDIHTLSECVINNKKYRPGVNVTRTRAQAEHPEILPV